MTSSLSPLGATSDSMSVTKPYLYSWLTSVSTDELMSCSWVCDFGAEPHVVFAGAAAAQHVLPRLDLGAQHLGEEPRLRRADLGKPLGHRRNGAVVLGQRAAAGLRRAPRPCSPLPRAPGHGLEPLSGRRAGQLASEPAGEAREIGLEQRHRGVAPLALDHLVQQRSEGLLVAPREERLARRRSAGRRTPARRRRGARARRPPGLRLELLQVVPRRVEREPQPAGKFLGRQLARALELHEDRPPLAFWPSGSIRIDQGEGSVAIGRIISGKSGLSIRVDIIGVNVPIHFYTATACTCEALGLVRGLSGGLCAMGHDPIRSCYLLLSYVQPAVSDHIAGIPIFGSHALSLVCTSLEGLSLDDHPPHPPPG